MSEKAKPTPGPWLTNFTRFNGKVIGFRVLANLEIAQVSICEDGQELENAEANALLIAEAGTVYHETGLTPRQLLEQRDELASLVKLIPGLMAGIQGAGVAHFNEKRAEREDKVLKTIGKDPFTLWLERVEAYNELFKISNCDEFFKTSPKEGFFIIPNPINQSCFSRAFMREDLWEEIIFPAATEQKGTNDV
ncbi:hypothetical protein VF14_18305 [Nostoc linckia z18]|uniref:Uncharacterized protein n=2 Tax=Nostoc linckia TaxID=92942 RepID=A0A9Q6EJN6_NOSLI|nr:hypothetical protein [Nostoc linckia]PHJ53455.1 hypothetical protein VF02_37190 [Nostoc linckia z1]PHJ81977.1 hypothetical protein VF07_29225 [Nostoc linckia z6]PHJ92875.1 hypothetical protein VF04_27940 [Nostoc linckia z7]PHK00802.1 hypothetical protein VF08_23305 [Nostoc linckia z8]PHK09320.1 hypothetical protein VF09_16000 [Nostoc linckia z9]